MVYYSSFQSVGTSACWTKLYYFSPNQQKCSSSLSCEFLFPDSLVKNSMSGHPWHTNLPSIPHLTHLWQQYGLRLSPLPLLVNMLKQMLYDPCFRHLTLASVCFVHRGLHCHKCFFLTNSVEGYWGVTPYQLNGSCGIFKAINHNMVKK